VLAAHQDAPVTIGSAPDSEVDAGEALTLERPGVGTIVVTTRRLTTLRTRLGRAAALGAVLTPTR